MDSLTPTDNVVSYLDIANAQKRVTPATPLPVTATGLSQSGLELTPAEYLAAILDEIRGLRLDIQQLQGAIISPN